MTIDQESLSLSDKGIRRIGALVPGMHPMQQASLRIADFRDGRSLLKAKDLVGLLLCHGARAWRASQPTASLRVAVRNGYGSPAVRLRLR